MPWDINQINREFMSNLPQPGEAFQAGQDESFKRRVLEAQIATQQQQAALAQQRAKQKQIDVQSFIAKPTAQGAAALQAAYPEDMAAFKESWATRDADTQKNDLREMSAIHGYLKSGMPDRAKVLVQQRIDADKAAGQNTTEDEQFLAAINEDPNKASGLMALMLAPIVGPEKFDSVYKNVGDSERANAKLPGEVALTEAQAGKAAVEAEMAPAIIETEIADKRSEIARRAQQSAIEREANAISRDRVALDRDALFTNTQLKLDEMAQTGTEVKGASLDEMTKAVTSAQANEALANRTSSLANRFAASNVAGRGWASAATESLAGAFGNQDPVTALRGEYEQIKNSQAIKNLPPGPATDRDIQIAMRGFPPATASKEYVVSFLRGLEKLQRKTAQADQRRGDWISSNGTIGTAKRPIVVDGWTVQPGTTFAQFNKNMLSLDELDPQSLDEIEERYRK